MGIIVNRLPEEYPEDYLTPRQILDRRKRSFPLIVAKLDDKLVDRKDYESTWVRDGAMVR